MVFLIGLLRLYLIRSCQCQHEAKCFHFITGLLRCSVLAFRFSQEWDVNMALGTPHRLDKEISFSIIILFFVFLAGQNKQRRRPAVFLAIVHCLASWPPIANINCFNMRGRTFEMTAKWQTGNSVSVLTPRQCVSRSWITHRDIGRLSAARRARVFVSTGPTLEEELWLVGGGVWVWDW